MAILSNNNRVLAQTQPVYTQQAWAQQQRQQLNVINQQQQQQRQIQAAQDELNYQTKLKEAQQRDAALNKSLQDGTASNSVQEYYAEANRKWEQEKPKLLGNERKSTSTATQTKKIENLQGSTIQNPVMRNVVNSPLNQIVQGLLYYGNYPTAEVEKAKLTSHKNPFANLYALSSEYLLSKPQEAAQTYADLYVNNRVNPSVGNIVAKTAGGFGAGAIGIASSVPAIAYGITQQLTGKKRFTNEGVSYVKEEVIPNMVNAAERDPLLFGSELAGAITAGALASKVPSIKAGNTIKTPKTGKTTKSETLSTGQRISDLPDPSAGLTAKQIASTALTNKDALSSIPGRVTHTLTKSEIKLRYSVGDALKNTNRDRINKQLITISQETTRRNAQAPITVNVADITTKITGIKDSQQSGFAVSIKPATVSARKPLSNTGNFIKSTPKDMSKRAGKNIVQTLNQPNKPTVSYSAGPNSREIILQWDPSQNVYMKLKENGAGRYDYIGDLTPKQVSQLEKLDTNTGSMAKSREYDILNEPGYVRPNVSPLLKPSIKEGKYYVPYKNDYGFNVEVSKGKTKYTLVDQLFHKDNNFPNTIKEDQASKIIATIEDGKDIQLKSAYERFQDYKATPAGRNVASQFATVDYATSPLSGYQPKISGFAQPKTVGMGLMPDYGLTPMQKNLRQQRVKWEAESQKRVVNLVEGIENKPISLPDGLTSSQTVTRPININVKPIVKPISKETFKIINSRTKTKQQTNGRTATQTVSNVKSIPTVRPKTEAVNGKPRTTTQPKQIIKETFTADNMASPIPGIASNALTAPLTTATMNDTTANAVITGSIPIPAVIPSTGSISQVLDQATAESTSTATSTATSTTTTLSEATAEATTDSIADAFADAIVDTATLTTTTTTNLTVPISIPTNLSATLTRTATATISETQSRKTQKRKEETRRKRKVTKIPRQEETKKKRRIRKIRDIEKDERKRKLKIKKSRKYRQIENYIPWLDADDETNTKNKWYMFDAKLMRTTKKITPAIKRLIDAYNKTAKAYNEVRKKLLKMIRISGRTPTGKKAAIQLKKMYRDTKLKELAVRKAVKP